MPLRNPVYSIPLTASTPDNHPGYVPGKIYSCIDKAANVSNVSPFGITVFGYIPWYLPKAANIELIIMNLVVVSSGTFTKLDIFNNENGLPSTRKLALGTVNNLSNTQVAWTVNSQFDAGFHWLGLRHTSNEGYIVTGLVGSTNSQINWYLGFNNRVAGAEPCFYTKANVDFNTDYLIAPKTDLGTPIRPPMFWFTTN
ncbi:MAG: hypothetical protein KME23_17680 [Goleter apudmare HA4340-LM2]|jgi:hypothetical protein|nr:hypothetical protein [Goleter apudmare HA4340-LM2]MBW4644792.1 hypothetical protein [Goleter apudmare HA4340-LM2]